MKVEQRIWRNGEPFEAGERLNANLVLVFASRGILDAGEAVAHLVRAYPNAHVVGCTTAGEICDTDVLDDTAVVTAIELEHSSVRVESVRGGGSAADSRALGTTLAARIPRLGLRHVVVLAPGSGINGSELTAGMHAALAPDVAVTGGLAGDGERFERTLVTDGRDTATDMVVAVGLYGDRLRIGYGSMGGWDPFGPDRRITRSEGNILYELDGEPALDLYKSYLAEEAAGLPASALRFPLELRGSSNVVRTVLGVDEAARSMIFAGDMPEGVYARLMKANFERLIDGAGSAATVAAYARLGAPRSGDQQLAILVSCVGRRLVLGQRVEEELEGVREVLGPSTVLSGFYSYGEICPTAPNAGCELHNQTMTITTIQED